MHEMMEHKVQDEKPKTKIIFLDIDGVLNSYREIRKAGEALEKKMKEENRKQTLHERLMLDNPYPEHVKWLNKITDETGAYIVISSAWRDMADIMMWNRFLMMCGITGIVIGVTPILGTYRGIEILTWLLQYRDKHYNPSYPHGFIESFVIIDDDADAEMLQSRLVLCDDGLREKEADKAIELLNTSDCYIKVDLEVGSDLYKIPEIDD